MAHCEKIKIFPKAEGSGQFCLKNETKSIDDAVETLVLLAGLPNWQRIDYVAPDGTEDSIVPEQLRCETIEELPDVEQTIVDFAQILPGSEKVLLVLPQTQSA